MTSTQPQTDADAASVVATLHTAHPPHEALCSRPGTLFIDVLEGTDRGHRFTIDLRRRRRVTAGRGLGHDVVLTDGSVSNSHFELVVHDDRIELADLGSTNGLWVGNVSLQRAWLTDGAEFLAGKCKLRVHVANTVEFAVSTADRYGSLIGRTLAMRELFVLIDRVAKTPLTVLLTGETGTGKELVARALHNGSDRADKPFMVLDCTSIPRELAESTLFGHIKGAFTGALTNQAGIFENARGGTVLLDEIGELPPELQPKLLRVLERREVQRIGAPTAEPIDVRIVAATHRDLRKMVANDEFRLDLYQRLAQFEMSIPPLRERRSDIPLLSQHFLAQTATDIGRTIDFNEEALALLSSLHWEGNVRQLKTVCDRTAYLAEGDTIGRRELQLWLPKAPDYLPQADLDPPTSLLDKPLKEACRIYVKNFHRRYCERLLERVGGNLEEAARLSGYGRKQLRTILIEAGLMSESSG